MTQLVGSKELQRKQSIWFVSALIGAALVAVPILIMTTQLFRADEQGIWAHLVDTVLWRYVWGSLAICSGAVVVAVVIGTATAWATTRLHFPGVGLLSWTLLLPMAVPSYVLAYCWTDLLEYAGPVQTWIREQTGWVKRDYWFPQVRSIPGAILMFGLTLYPYVYLPVRASLVEQGAAMFESARSLGWGPWRCFFRLALPLSRPALVGGCSLVAMETLADYGTVDYFGVPTFTTGIYRTWNGFGSYSAAVKLAAVMLLVVVVLLSIERISRGGRRFHRVGARQQQDNVLTLIGWRSWLTTVACCLPIVLGFAIPCIILTRHVWSSLDWDQLAQITQPAMVSLQLALGTALVVLVAALLLAYGRRLVPSRLLMLVSRIAASGYCIPGSVIAVAVIVPLAWIDNQILDPVIDSGLLLSGGLIILIYAYVVRFLAVALTGVESGLAAIPLTMDHAARGLGAGPLASLGRIHLPLMGASLATAALLVIVDVIKELPATILLRPAGVTTLAVQVHEQVSQEDLQMAALPALAIVVVGLGPVLLLNRRISRARMYGGKR